VVSLYDIPVTTIDGTGQSMAEYRGKTLLIVNVASRCGYTPQYAGLEALYRKFQTRDFLVLGFPCNQFAGQEPGSSEQIVSFCSTRYDVTFPLFVKIDVNGAGAHPLYTLLKTARPGLLGITRIRWNFTKFLVSAGGEVLRRYGSSTLPSRIEPDIEAQVAPVSA
jgi:glutathione peroxidase